MTHCDHVDDSISIGVCDVHAVGIIVVIHREHVRVGVSLYGWVLVDIGHTIVFENCDVVPVACTEASLWAIVWRRGHHPYILIFTVSLASRNAATLDSFAPVSNLHLVVECVSQWDRRNRLAGLLCGIWTTHDHEFHVGDRFIKEQADDVVMSIIIDVCHFQIIQIRGD